MKATSSVPSGGVRPARISLERKSAQARLSPSGNTTVKCSRFATAGQEVREAMSAPVWVLPWSAITSGAGFTSASCALKVRFPPLMVMVSANAVPAAQASANIAASDLRRCRVMSGSGGEEAKPILQNCSRPCLQLFREQEPPKRIIAAGGQALEDERH